MSCEENEERNVDEVFQLLLQSSREQVETNELVGSFRKIWKELGFREVFLDGEKSDVNTLYLLLGLVRKYCETSTYENYDSATLSFLEFSLQHILPCEEELDSDSVEVVLKKLLEFSSLLLFEGYGKDLSRLFELEASLLRVAILLFVKLLQVPVKRPKTLGIFAPEIFYICLFLCYWLSPEDISWVKLEEFSKEKIEPWEAGPSVANKKNSAYWTVTRSIQLLGIYKRVQNVQCLAGQLWPSLQPLFIKTLRYEDHQRKNKMSSGHSSFLSFLIKYCLLLMNVEDLESHISSLLTLLVPLSQDFDRQRRIQTIQCFQLLIYRCSSFVVEEHKSSFYIILRVLCRFREPKLIEALLECIIHFIQKIKTRSKDCFDERCSSEFYSLVDAVIDIISYCTLSSSSFAIDLNELGRVVSIHLVGFLRVVDKRIYPRLQRLLPCLCELLEKMSASTKCIETNSFQNIAESLKFLLDISQPFIRFYLQTLVGTIFTCVSKAKMFLTSEKSEMVCTRCVELLDIVRIHSEPVIFWKCLNESEEMGKELPGLVGVTEWIVRYRKHVTDTKCDSDSLEKVSLDTFDELLENSFNPFKLYLDTNA